MERNHEEKRKFMRMLVDCKAHCKDAAAGELFTARVHDLSSGGLGFSMEREAEPGRRLEVRIVPEKALVPPLHAEVEVVHVIADAGGGRYRVGARILAHK